MSGPDERPERGPRRLLAAGAGLVVLLAIVAYASRGHAPAGSAAETRPPSQMLFDVFVTFVLLLVVATLIAALSVGRKVTGKPPSSRSWISLLIFVTVISLVAVFAGKRIAGFLAHGGNGKKPPAAAVAEAAKKRRKEELQRRVRPVDDPTLRWEVPAAVFGVLGVAALAWVARDRARRRKGILTERMLAEQLSELLDETLDDLRAERDPRKAVIAAYARMERLLAAHGLPRKPSEAPREYMSRVLSDLRVTEPAVRRLTDVYLVAKFSTHEIAPELRDDAIEALEAVQTDLRAIDFERTTGEGLVPA